MEKQYKILIVDDEFAIGTYVKRFLEKIENKFTVEYINDPIKALDFVKSHRVDLLIVDLVMPLMNGFELAEKVRNKKKQVPIVIYSSVTSNEDRIRALNAPIFADAFVSKSDDSLELLAYQIRSVFWRREALVITDKLKTVNKIGFSIDHYVSQSLTAIIGYSDILKKNLEEEKIDKDKFYKFLEIIKKSADKIDSVLKDVENLKEIEMVDIGNDDTIYKVTK